MERGYVPVCSCWMVAWRGLGDGVGQREAEVGALIHTSALTLRGKGAALIQPYASMENPSYRPCMCWCRRCSVRARGLPHQTTSPEGPSLSIELT